MPSRLTWMIIVTAAMTLLCAILLRSPSASISGVENVNQYSNISQIMNHATTMASHSWEYGAAAQALLELHNPELTEFHRHAFLDRSFKVPLDVEMTPGLKYARQHIWTNNSDTLTVNEGSPSDPASLGIPAILLGVGGKIPHLTEENSPSDSSNRIEFFTAASRQVSYLLHNATRFPINSTASAISHRNEPAELWGDFIYMAPPLLAYFGAVEGNFEILEEAVHQCELYRDALVTDVTTPNGTKCSGLWKHIVSVKDLAPDICCTDPYAWLTSNAWAVTGMVRVLVSVMHSNAPNALMEKARTTLLDMISSMLSCALLVPADPETSLLPNYLDYLDPSLPTSAWAFGDAAGTALMASAVYRAAVIRPDLFAVGKYIEWADGFRTAVVKHIGVDGKVGPVASPYEVPSKISLDASSEGQSMVGLMLAAWRDWQMFSVRVQ